MSSSSSNSITAADVREWFSAAERGETRTFFMEHVDENVHWTVTTPADGPLGKTTPIAGEWRNRTDWLS